MHLQSESLTPPPRSPLTLLIFIISIIMMFVNGVGYGQRQLQSLENRGTEGGRSTRMGPTSTTTTTTMSLGQLHMHLLPFLYALALRNSAMFI